MGMISGRLTVFFDEPFWVGVFERVCDGKLSTAKVTFGALPSEQEIYGFVLKNYSSLEFGPTVDAPAERTQSNPKRARREAQRQARQSGVGTRSQQALKLQHEQQKCERREYTRQQKLADAERRFELRKQKKKEKHKGR
jgi:hypothetical protein